MSGYADFSRFYDRLQANVPYGDIARLFDGFIKEYSAENEVVVDIACGTGSLCFELEKLGYDVIGTDISQDMLNEALDKKYELGSSADFLCQSMTELDLFGAADVILCTLDSLNHLDRFEDMSKVIERVSMFTCDGGLFIFDVNTPYKHEKILGSNAFTFDTEGLYCGWQNVLNDDGSVTVYLDFFEEREDGSYQRYSESFTERTFEQDKLEKCLVDNKFEIIGKFDDFSKEPVNEETQRILYVCRRLAR